MKEEFLNRSIPLYTVVSISLRTCTRTEFIRTKDISLVEGERDNFYRGGREVVLTRSGVYELEIIYVDIYIYIFSLERRNSSGLFRTQTREDRFDRWW